MSEAARQIRAYRQLRGISLRQLAETLGISHSQLSKIESGKAKLTVETALKIAGVLQVPASIFLAQPAPQATARRVITRHHSGGMHETPGMSFEVLCPGFKEKHNMFWRVTISATTLEANGGWRQHPGQEFIYVLSGDLELHSSYYEPLVLKQGDSILFDADQPHAYVAIGEPAELLMMNSVV